MSKPAPKTRIRPINNMVLVKQDKGIEQTEGGIVLPEDQVKAPMRGTVIAVGPGKLHEDGTRDILDVKVGDQVFLAPFANTELEFEGEKFLIMPEVDIMAVLEK